MLRHGAIQLGEEFISHVGQVVAARLERVLPERKALQVLWRVRSAEGFEYPAWRGRAVTLDQRGDEHLAQRINQVAVAF